MKNPELERIFIQLIQANERLIYKVCSFYVSEKLPLEDLYQEVVYNLWKAFPKFRNESAESTWIYRIALNTCISGIRKELRRPVHISLLDLHDNLVESNPSDPDIQEMYRLIRQLKTIERAVVLLYLEEKSYKEISEITGLSINNVAIKLMRVKEKLKKMSNN